MPGAQRINRRWRVPRATIHHDESGIGVAQCAEMAARLKADGHPSFSRPAKTPIVYFIRAGANGPIKIGFTSNLQRRLEFLQSGNHHRLKCLHTIAGTARLEREMHRRFEQLRITGEWFRYEGELRAFLRGAR
jgi:hypothetical protein